jgi:hypothetical protein
MKRVEYGSFSYVRCRRRPGLIRLICPLRHEPSLAIDAVVAFVGNDTAQAFRSCLLIACSTRLRLLPTFLTAFFTADADLRVFFPV